ncbi:MAG: hypothetical protein HAW60_05980 [Bdellovibrionales bacterium]|nr:hypothetical protein [Bdellovibrionales bacterium]
MNTRPFRTKQEKQKLIEDAISVKLFFMNDYIQITKKSAIQLLKTYDKHLIINPDTKNSSLIMLDVLKRIDINTLS